MLLPEEKFHRLGTRRESSKKNASLFLFSRRFWLKELRHSDNISGEKCYLYRGTRHISPPPQSMPPKAFAPDQRF